MGRLLERAVREQIQFHLEKQDILPPNLHGFRKGCSTASAINEVMDLVKDARAKKKKVITNSEFGNNWSRKKDNTVVSKLLER